MNDQTATAALRSGPDAEGAPPIPNPLAVVVPIAAVTAAALLVMPLVAAERFAGGRERTDEPREESEREGGDEPAAEARQGAAAGDETAEVRQGAAAGDETAAVPESAAESSRTAEDSGSADGSEPIAIDSRQGTRQNGVKRGERIRSERPARDERQRRRNTPSDTGLRAIGVAPLPEGAAMDVPSLASSEIGPPPAGGADPSANQGPPVRVGEDVVAPPVGTEGDASGPEAEAEAPTAADAQQPIELQQAIARRGLLVAPIIDTSSQSPRAVERIRMQKEAAEKVILNSPDVTAAVAPLVRHVNTVTEQLNQAQVTIGRLTAERDALRQQLTEETGTLAEQLDRQMAVELKDPERRQSRLLRQEAREEARTSDGEEADEPGAIKRFFQRAGFIIPDDASEEEFKRAVRRRQMIAVVFLAVIGLGLWSYQQDPNNTVGKMSRESLADIQYVGAIFQVLLVAWMVYRVVRVGGRGAKWLFPQQKTRRRKR